MPFNSTVLKVVAACLLCSPLVAREACDAPFTELIVSSEDWRELAQELRDPVVRERLSREFFSWLDTDDARRFRELRRDPGQVFEHYLSWMIAKHKLRPTPENIGDYLNLLNDPGYAHMYREGMRRPTESLLRKFAVWYEDRRTNHPE